MSRRSKIDIMSIFVPANTDASHRRIKEVAAKYDIESRAYRAGQKNEPSTDDTNLDETERSLVDESQMFVASVTRLAGTEIAERAIEMHALLPRPMDTALEQSNIRRQVSEAKEQYKDELELAQAERQRALRDLRAFEEKNGLAPLSAIYKEDKAVFFAVLLALMLAESLLNTFFLEALQERGLVGALLLAVSVGVANVLIALGCGFLGWRLLLHARWGLRFLGILLTLIFMLAALALHLALGDLREAITHNTEAQIDFRIILYPTRWFAYTSLPPFVLFAIGVATFVIVSLKGRGGTWGVVAPYWHHDTMDWRFREADRAYEDAKANFKDALANAYDGERAKLLAKLDDDEAHAEEIRKLTREARDLERVLGDSLDAELGRLHIWQRMYRDHNRAVRNSPAPQYFDHYPEFAEWRSARLDLSDIHRLAEAAEKNLAENRTKLAALQDKMLQEQTAASDAMATVLSATERRASLQVEKDDAAAKPRAA
jgi:hypothetical protein